MTENMEDLNALMQRIGYEFKDQDLLALALTHRSAMGENNERLEFLGDSVIGFIIAAELFAKQSQLPEGDLSRLRSTLVRRETLAEVANHLEIGEHLKLGAGELRSGGKTRASILANTVEAIIGALYLDAGFEKTKDCVLNWYANGIADLSAISPQKDAKTRLQEWTQAEKVPLPHYVFTVTGKSHEQVFDVICTVDGVNLRGEGTSHSRRKAEQIAAQHFLDQLDG